MSSEGSQAAVRRRRAMALAVIAVLGLLLVVAAVRGGGDGPADGPRTTSLLDALAPVLGTGAARSTPVEGDLGVPLDRAAAQLFVVGLAGTTPRAAFLRRLRVRDWGGIVLTDRNWSGSPRRLRSLVRGLRTTAARAGHTPPLLAAAIDPPDAVPVAAAGPSADGARRARRAARGLAAAGLNAVLGPSFDLAYAAGPWEDAGLPEGPTAARARARQAVRTLRAARLEPVPGHFPGEGGASADPALAPAQVGLGLADLRRADLQPYAATATDVRAVQLSAAFYVDIDPVTPATLLPQVVRLLREVDPDAVAVSADLQSVALATGRPVGDLAVEALRAGCDLLHLPGDAQDQERAFRAVVRAIRTRELPRRRVREALLHVASLKRRAGVVRLGGG